MQSSVKAFCYNDKHFTNKRPTTKIKMDGKDESKQSRIQLYPSRTDMVSDYLKSREKLPLLLLLWWKFNFYEIFQTNTRRRLINSGINFIKTTPTRWKSHSLLFVALFPSIMTQDTLCQFFKDRHYLYKEWGHVLRPDTCEEAWKSF